MEENSHWVSTFHHLLLITLQVICLSFSVHAWLKWCPYQNCPQPNCLLTQAQFILLWYLAVPASWRHIVLHNKTASNNLESCIQKSLSKPQSMNFSKSYMIPIVWLQMRVCQDSLSTAEEIGTLDQCCLSVHFENSKSISLPRVHDWYTLYIIIIHQFVNSCSAENK
jgi:hypothetical protein